MTGPVRRNLPGCPKKFEGSVLELDPPPVALSSFNFSCTPYSFQSLTDNVVVTLFFTSLSPGPNLPLSFFPTRKNPALGSNQRSGHRSF